LCWFCFFCFIFVLCWSCCFYIRIVSFLQYLFLQVPQMGCYKHVLILQRRTVVKRYWRKETIRM
jgi:hypothetical protein